MGVTLEDLAAHVNEHGVKMAYQNGPEQWGVKKTPEADYYTTLMQRYVPAMKQLIECLPEAAPGPGGNSTGSRLMAYVTGDGRA